MAAEYKDTPVFLPLNSQDQFDQVLARSDEEPVVLFKHSKMCGISSMAYRRMSQVNEGADPPIFTC